MFVKASRATLSVSCSLLLTSVGGPEEGITREAARALQADGAPVWLGEACSALFQPGPHSIQPAKYFMLLRGECAISGGSELDVLWQLPAGTASSSLTEAMYFPGNLHVAQSGEGWGLRCPVPAKILETQWVAVVGCTARVPVSSLFLWEKSIFLVVVSFLSDSICTVFLCVLSESTVPIFPFGTSRFGVPSAYGISRSRFS